MYCGIQNIRRLTMKCIVKCAGVASLRFHKISLATWCPISNWHCCVQKPAPSCFFAHQRPRDAKVHWRLSSDCRILLALKSTISSELPVFPMAFIPLGFAVSMTPESLWVCSETWCINMNLNSSNSFTSLSHSHLFFGIRYLICFK